MSAFVFQSIAILLEHPAFSTVKVCLNHTEVQLLQSICVASRTIEVPVKQTEVLFGLRTSCINRDILLEMSKPRYL